MQPVVSIIAPGNMGAALAHCLTTNGVEVRTSLEGRGPASAERARHAGMIPSTEDQIVEADFVLSVVPPGDALALAERLALPLAAAARKPVYVDCNAVDPNTALRIEAVVAPTGAAFVDGGIIGMPPSPGSTKTILYVSGKAAGHVETLGGLGLNVRVVDGPVGAASALKMSYAGITKGFTALGAAMMLAAARAGTTEDLFRELSASQPHLLAWLSRSVPNMYTKAYRWVAEMEEISTFVGDDPAAAKFFQGAAELYRRLADDHAGDRREIALMDGFCARKPS